MKITLHLKPIIFIISLLVLWQVTSNLFFNDFLFPSPISVGRTLWELTFNGELISSLISSSFRLILGITLGVIFGVTIGLISGRIKWIDETISPCLNIIRAFPPVAIIPLVIVWFGISDFSKIMSIAFAVIFPVWLNTLSAAKQIPSDYLKATKIFTSSKRKGLFKVIIPACLPSIITGTRLGIGVGFIMVFVAELAGSSSGLGFLIANAQVTYRMDILIAGLIVLGCFAALVDYLFVKTSEELFPWLKLT